MHTLYWGPSTGAFAVQVVLEELGLPYRAQLVDTDAGDQRSPGYLALNPMGQVPTLVLPDGTVLTESAAMVLHLCDTAPAAGLLPEPGTPARALAYRWLFWLAVEHYCAELRGEYPDRYTDDPAGTEGVKAAALARLDRLFAMTQDRLGDGPYALGDRFSAVDPYLFMVSLWHPDRRAALERFPKIGAHARRMRTRPAVERVWDRHYPPGGSHPWSTWTSSSGF
jgi:glutathione S-transferase